MTGDMTYDENTECDGLGCFARDWCARFSANPGENRFEQAPIGPTTGHCDYFIPTSSEYADVMGKQGG